MLPPKKEHVEDLDWIRFIEGYDGDYAVTRRGKIASYKTHHLPTRAWLSAARNSDGHLNVALYSNGARRTHSVHRLVAAAFIGPCPEGLEVCHNDGVPGNNHASNLRYDTRKANAADMVAHGTAMRGERHPRSKLKEHDVRSIRVRHKQGSRLVDLAEEFGVGTPAIHKIVTRRTWRHIED